MSEPTSHARWGRVTGCLSGVGTYLPATVLQGCSLFKQCRNLSVGDCVTGVQAVYAMSEPTFWALCCRGAICLSGVITYLQGTVCRGAGCLSLVGTYLPGTVLQGKGLFKLCRNIPTGHFIAGCRLFKQC